VDAALGVALRDDDVMEIRSVQRGTKNAAMLALCLMIAAADALPAFAGKASNAPPTTRSWHGRSAVRLHLSHRGDARRLKSGAILGPSKEPPDDLCDLPSTGCESFLAN
jgi:hypothetical protein